MHIEKRGETTPEETAAEGLNETLTKTDSKHKPVVLYLFILFAIAFILILFSFVMHQRSNAEVLKELQSQVETLQQLQEVENQYKAAQDENDALREQVDALTEQAAEDARTQRAMSLVWQLERLYLTGDNEECREVLKRLQNGDLYLSLPTANENADGAQYESPRAAYDRINAELNAETKE